MDVVCERCKTEYEFDDALVSERGTTVKCTNCGHQFKIYRPSGDPDAARVWNLRRPDGTVIPFDSLAVLQKWILEGRVSKMDEISRTGEPWKSLGAIAELESFFATAELRSPQGSVLRGPSRPAQGMTPGRSLTPPSLPGPQRPVAPRAPAPMSLAGGTIRPGFPAQHPGYSTGAMPSVAPGGISSQSTSVGVPPIPSTAAAHAPPRLPTPVRGTSVRPPSPPPSAPMNFPPPPRVPAEMGLSGTAPAGDRAGPDAYSMGAGGVARSDGFSLGEVPRAQPLGFIASGELPDALARPRSAAQPGAQPAAMERGLTPAGLAARPQPMRAPTPAPVPGDTDADAEGDTEGDTDVARPPRGNASGLVIGLSLGLLVAGGGVALAWNLGYLGTSRPSAVTTPRITASANPAAPAIAQALQIARSHTPRGYEDASEALTRAIALDGSSTRAVAARAEVQAAWSELRRQQADDLEVRAALPGADAAVARAQAAVFRHEADDRAERARTDQQTAERSLATVPPAERGDAEAMLADVARVLGDRATAQRHMDAARQGPETSPEAELYGVLLDRDTLAPVVAIARLRAVVTRAPDLDRARVALARLLASVGGRDEARTQLDAVLAAHPGHDDVALLQRALAHNEPPMQAAGTAAVAVAVAPDAGGAVAATPGVSAGAPPDAGAVAPAGTPTQTAAAGGGGNNGAGEGAMPHAYDDLVADGERLQNDGRSAQARERFARALAQRPGGCEALTGMGYVALDEHDVSGAISRFRQALAGNPRYSEAFIGLGEAYSLQGNYTQALEAYNQYLEINPSGSRAGMARRQVESLQDRIQGASQRSQGAPGGDPPAGEHRATDPPPSGDSPGP